MYIQEAPLFGAGVRCLSLQMPALIVKEALSLFCFPPQQRGKLAAQHLSLTVSFQVPVMENKDYRPRTASFGALVRITRGLVSHCSTWQQGTVDDQSLHHGQSNLLKHISTVFPSFVTSVDLADSATC